MPANCGNSQLHQQLAKERNQIDTLNKYSLCFKIHKILDWNTNIKKFVFYFKSIIKI